MSNPFAEYDQTPADVAANDAAPTVASGNPFRDYAEEPEQAAAPVQGQGTPEQPFSAVITFTEQFQKARKVGQAGFRESALGHSVMSGRMTLEEAVAKIKEDDELAQLTSDLAEYEKQSAAPWLTSIALATAKQLPMVEASLGIGAGGFAIGGGLTAATGVGAPVSIPVGAMTGTAAAAGWTADFVKGQDYLDKRMKGMTHEEAAASATVNGWIQGALTGVRIGQAAKLPVNTAKNILQAHAQSITQFIGQALQFESEQIMLAELGGASKRIVDAIAGTVSNKPGVVPTLEQSAAEVAETFEETLKGSLGLFLGGKLTGTVAGNALKTFFKQAHDKHLAKQQAKLQKIQEAEAAAAEGEAVQSASADSGTKAVSKTAQERQRIAQNRLEKRIAAENEIRRIFEAAHSLFYTADNETRLQEVGRIQRLLKRMVNNSDLLDDKMKAKLLSRVVEIDGVADLLKHGERFIEEQWDRERANALTEARTRLKAEIKKGQEKNRKATLPPEAQKSLQWYDEFFSEPKLPKREKGQPKRQPGEAEAEVRAAALKKAVDYVEKGAEEEAQALAMQIDKLEKNELSEIFNYPAELAEKRRIAMQAVQYWSGALDQAGIVDLADQVQTLVKDERSLFLEKKKAEGQKLLGKRAQVLEGVQGRKPVQPSTDPNGPRQITPLGKVVSSIRGTASYLWDKLFQDTPIEQRQALKAMLDFTDVENKESAINIKAAEKMADLYTEAVGSIHEATRLIRDGANPKNRLELRYTDATGAPVVEYHTPNELAYLSIAMEDRGAIPGLVNGNKYTLAGMVEGGISTQEAVKAVLTQHEGGKYLALGKAVKNFYAWFAPTVANHYLKEYGVSMPVDDSYSGTIFHRQLERIKSAGDILQDVHNQAQRSLDPGATKARKNSKMPVKLVDPFKQVQRHRADMAFWIANSEKARELSFIFSDTTKDGLRDVIEHKFGREFTGLVDARLAWQFHLKPGIADVADGPFQTIKSNMATGLLGARIDQAPKQWTSILAALSNASFPEFLDGLKAAIPQYKEGKLTWSDGVADYISRSELYKDRQSHILPQILEATKDRGFVDTVLSDKALSVKTFFLTPMHKWGDGVGAAVAGFIEYNRVLKSGGSVEEAVLAGDRLVDQTQSSSRASQKVPGEFKGGVANLGLAFAKEGIQAINRESGAIRDWYIHRDEASLRRVARVIVSIHVAQTLFQAINNAPGLFFPEDDNERAEAALRVASATIGGSYAQMPLVGIDVFHGFLSGWKGQNEPRTIVGSLAGDTAKLVKRLWSIVSDTAGGEEVDGEDWVKAFKSLASVGSVTTGLPFWGLFKYAELGGKIAKKGAGE
ncbi:MAG: hypothetical protein K2Y32_00320 [Candidatus Obscuribacterales bacterium]|nr:hypothetical protein [Candidatus Obscuribacterales bacterium]